MKATLIYTDNEEVQDLVGVKGKLIHDESDKSYHFVDMTFFCEDATQVNDTLQIVSSLGYTYHFRVTEKTPLTSG